MKNEKATLVKFNALQVSYWWSFASMPAYIGAYLLARGMTNTQLSLLLAVYMLFAFLGQFFWGSACDRLETNKKIFILGNLIALGLNLFIYFFAGNLPAVFIAYPLLGFTLVPLPSNLDTWLLKCFAHRSDVYGPSRGWASMGFALFMLFYGSLINRVGYWVMPLFVTALTLTTVAIASMQPDAPKPEGPRVSIKIADIGKLTKIKPYMFLVVFLLFTGLASAPINNMKIAVLKNVGGNVSHQGYDFFFMCTFQLPFFFLAGRIRRIPLKARLVLTALLPTVMIGFNLLATSPATVIMGSVFGAVSFGILLPTTREIVGEQVDVRLRTTANSVTDAVYQSLSGMLSLLYVGAVMDNFGMRTVFLICMSIQVIPIALALGSLLRRSGGGLLLSEGEAKEY